MNAVVASIAIVLIISEVGLFSGYFARNWPSLSIEHGFVSLASAMIVLGVHVLSCLNQSSNSKEHLGMAFWRVVIMAGILNLILGVFNLIAVSLYQKFKAMISRECIADWETELRLPRQQPGNHSTHGSCQRS